MAKDKTLFANAEEKNMGEAFSKAGEPGKPGKSGKSGKPDGVLESKGLEIGPLSTDPDKVVNSDPNKVQPNLKPKM